MLGTIDLTQFRAEDGSNTKRRLQAVYSPPAAAQGGYVTGGDPLVASDLKLGQLDYMDVGNAVTTGGTLYTPVYDYVNSKLMLFVGTTGAQVANATDLSALTIRFEAIGR